MRILRKCLFRALDRYCSVDAKDFFRVVFDLELAPLMKYNGCHEGLYYNVQLYFAFLLKWKKKKKKKKNYITKTRL